MADSLSALLADLKRTTLTPFHTPFLPQTQGIIMVDSITPSLVRLQRGVRAFDTRRKTAQMIFGHLHMSIADIPAASGSPLTSIQVIAVVGSTSSIEKLNAGRMSPKWVIYGLWSAQENRKILDWASNLLLQIFTIRRGLTRTTILRLKPFMERPLATSEIFGGKPWITPRFTKI
ncbi:hypothetical protein K470DRAFT_266297 [Piedraia hortae CBS 480.64]|uniref:Uncharacterized protein n=1 Tax=Piedraia hortae CBS 480.64 TaxID=1314780 RepID=A0A6A7BTS1_9PEZI|nr:hypothetical protein K470DRAFT_266297 [Piedraia hortae CBS 480.64]